MQALFGRKNRASYRLGDRVEVQVKSVDYYRQQIDLVTVNSNNGDRGASNDTFNAVNDSDRLSEGDLEPYTDDEP